MSSLAVSALACAIAVTGVVSPAASTHERDVAQLIALAKAKDLRCTTETDRSCIAHLGVVGRYAEVGFTGPHAGWMLAHRAGSGWKRILKSDQYLDANQIAIWADGITKANAAALDAATKAPWDGK